MELKKESIQMLRIKNKATSQVTFDEDYNVPDVKPDIGRMVQSKAEVSMDEECLSKLMNMIHELFPVEESEEFTVESGRPDSITKEKFRILKEAGVTRISINPQTMHQETLDLIGRAHTE